MRVFQDFNPEEVEQGAYVFSGRRFLVTAGDGTKVNTTATSNGGVGQMWGKRVTFICVRKDRYTKELIDASGEYSLSFLDNEQYRGAMKYLVAVSGRDEDKIKGARLNVGYYQGVPLIEEASNVIICRVLYKKEIGVEGFIKSILPEVEEKEIADYVIYVGEIKKVLIR
ncbi:flavin reductase family protein [Butyrivibrio sp. INlla14]|uniref:flavin reductase family protein n=1 Tax=Butyrivibrio sp. INlla14 TaxID=1520808 RepID=UPI0008761431|nr:flavin reductase [Butyrivibrio sp. INlla14]SCX89686.1 NADH-FMN oxidoreductase RutF, flavin reductase (DIM6/NTAB) family [Butyrivibrio sp. INlla14]